MNPLCQANPNFFFFSYSEILKRVTQEQLKNPPDTELIENLEAVIGYIKEDHAVNIQKYESSIATNTVTYDFLWAFFKPGALIYNFDDKVEQPRILKVKEFDYVESVWSGKPHVSLKCDMIHNNGRLFGLCEIGFTISPYKGAKKFHDLPCYPISFHPEADGLKAKLIARGRKLAAINQAAFCETMNGPATDTHGWKFHVRFCLSYIEH